MTLIDRVARADTIEQFERAAFGRLRDGRALRACERHYWAVYTLGYAVELCLKIAFFRLYGLSDAADATGALRIAPAWARQLGVTDSSRNLHDLLFWLRLVLAEREFRRRPLPQTWANDLTAHVLHVSKHWRPYLRYRAPVAAPVEAREVSAAATWVVQNRIVLWR